jgi:hypothetical protein
LKSKLKAKRDEGMDQKAERLPRKCEGLISNPSTANKENEIKKFLKKKNQLESKGMRDKAKKQKHLYNWVPEGKTIKQCNRMFITKI